MKKRRVDDRLFIEIAIIFLLLIIFVGIFLNSFEKEVIRKSPYQPIKIKVIDINSNAANYYVNDNIVFNGQWEDVKNAKLLISEDQNFANCDYNDNTGCLCASSSGINSGSCNIIADKPYRTINWHGRICDEDNDCEDGIVLKSTIDNAVIYYDYLFTLADITAEDPNLLNVGENNNVSSICLLQDCNKPITLNDILNDDANSGYFIIESYVGKVRSLVRVNFPFVTLPVNGELTKIDFRFDGVGHGKKIPDHELKIYYFDKDSNQWSLLGNLLSSSITKNSFSITSNLNQIKNYNDISFLVFDNKGELHTGSGGSGGGGGKKPKLEPSTPRSLFLIYIFIFILSFILVMLLFNKKKKIYIILPLILLSLSFVVYAPDNIESRIDWGYSDIYFFITNYWTNQVNIMNRAPVFDDNIVYIEGKLSVGSVNFKVLASDIDNDVLTFNDNTSLFDIDNNGNINFVVDNSNIGIHNVNISVSDGDLVISRDYQFELINDVVTPPTGGGPPGGGGGGGGGGNGEGETTITRTKGYQEDLFKFYIADLRNNSIYNFSLNAGDGFIVILNNFSNKTYFVNLVLNKNIELRDEDGLIINLINGKNITIDLDKTSEYYVEMKSDGNVIIKAIKKSNKLFPIIEKPQNLTIIGIEIYQYWLLLIILILVIVLIWKLNKLIMNMIYPVGR
ncbi:MAG TPA: hypothetical protein VJJ23_00160 [Candidatus Nanoarchaeia archaeon]|nr:hypothetical protein [Candidatus Nanoarchaeia archaeon]